MTERFSPEYKAFILSDDASVLQKGHEWNLGDWFVHRETESIGLLAIKPDDKILFVKKEAISWLPTLTDLLDMIEEAGWHWERHGPALLAARCLGYHEDTDEYEYETIREDIQGEDTILAAAKLAVRVLEGKE